MAASFNRTSISTRRKEWIQSNQTCTGLLRFIPKSDSSKVLIGQPEDESVDVGLALYKGQDVKVNVFSGTSALEPGSATGKTESIDKILSPITQKEAGAIRCIGLNVSLVAASQLRVLKICR